MDHQSVQTTLATVLALAARQHGVVTRAQLLQLGIGPEAIKHRLRNGRLHVVRRGVYAVGRPWLTRHGERMAAVLRCGPQAVLSHECAAAQLGIRTSEPNAMEVTVPLHAAPCVPGIVVHRRTLARSDVTRCHGIPVTAPACTLVDLAARLPRDELEAAINEADKRGLIDPESLRSTVHGFRGRRGVAVLRTILDRRTFTLTDSHLERRFLLIARKAGLSPPQTQLQVNGFRVDFYWPELGLVVETDGLRYHRTPAQQARDRLRDQAHAATGLTPLRFTHAQVAFEAAYVQRTLAAVAGRMA